MTDTLQGPVYLDANPIVYALEGPEQLASALKNLFSIFRQRPGLAVTSELTLAEVLPKKKIPDRQFYDLLVWSGMFDLRPVTREVLIETAAYRRTTQTRRSDGSIKMPKLPDAIHVVTAVRSGCQVFLSKDSGIKLPNAMRLVRADEKEIGALAQELS